MTKKNSVFIATSLDGFISDKNGKIDWLNSIPNPENDDMGYADFTSTIDAIVMGRSTFETVCGFNCDWPYEKPVFVLSNTLTELPVNYSEKAFLINGPLSDVLSQIHKKGLNRLYIDGGTTIRNFLNEDLIDEIIITTIPVLLGGGSPLFSEMSNELKFILVGSKTYLNQVVQSHYKRIR
jgi:dihydrofolate reductase